MVPLRHLQTCVGVDLGVRGRPVSAVDLAHGDWWEGGSLGRQRVGGVLRQSETVGTPLVWFTVVGLVLSRHQARDKSEKRDGEPERAIAVKGLHG